MSEQLKQSYEQESVNRTPAEMLEQALITIEDRAVMVAKERFNSPEAAFARANEFTIFASEAVNEIDRPGEVALRVTGETVHVPQVELTEFDDEENEMRGLAVVYNPKSAMRSLDMFESETVSTDGFWGKIIRHGEEEYGVQPLMVGVIHNVKRASVTMADSPVQIFETNMIRRALVELNGSSDITVVELEAVRKQAQLSDEMAQLALKNSTFVYQLNKLPQLFHHEDSREFVDLKNVKMLQRLGEIAAMYASRGMEYSTIVSEAINQKIGVGRVMQVWYDLEVSGEVVSNELVMGRYVDVMMPLGKDDDTEPSFVLEGVAEGVVTGDIHKVPFQNVTALKF